jgi:hypothetical protein
MTCAGSRPGPYRCPTAGEIMESALALLPRGRAWQSQAGGPVAPIDGGFADHAFDPEAFSVRERKGSVLWRFWRSVADVFAYLARRTCDLRLEFWCATHRETHDLWLAEYGLPDPCDPFPDLCAKVAALGGARCEYFNAIVARAGWTVDCVDWTRACGSQTGCARAGNARAGTARGARLTLVVHLAESPAFEARVRHAPPLAGRLRAGNAITCPEPEDISALKCLINRIAPAHVEIDYVTV